MKFYYTGANAYNEQQNNPSLSLGGYISSSELPNNVLNNLFSDISYLTFSNNAKENKAIILENDTGIDITGVTLGYKYPIVRNFNIMVAAVTLNVNSPEQIEKINSADIDPLFANFVEAEIALDDSFDNSIIIGDMVANARIAIWLQRNIIQPVALTDDQIYDYYKNLNSNNKKELSLIIKYQTP